MLLKQGGVVTQEAGHLEHAQFKEILLQGANTNLALASCCDSQRVCCHFIHYEVMKSDKSHKIMFLVVLCRLRQCAA